MRAGRHGAEVRNRAVIVGRYVRVEEGPQRVLSSQRSILPLSNKEAGTRWGPVRRRVRKRFGRDAPNPLNRIGHAGLGQVFGAPVRYGFGSGGAVRSPRGKILPGLGLAHAEPGSPSY